MNPIVRTATLSKDSKDSGIGTKPPVLNAQEIYLLLAIVLLAFVPRLLLSYRLVSICNDGFYYISVARSLEQGHFETAFAYLSLNIYPVILLCVHKLGFEWVRGAQIWGLLISSCTLFPLFGWVRRLFDNRTALAACFLFAIHPGLIELSIEPVREPTFWFFVMLCMFLILKSTEKRNFSLFMLTGIVLTMAIHTRSEGWLLTFPLLTWPTLVWWRDRRNFFKQALGTSLTLSVVPLILTLINLTILTGYREWEWGRLSHFQTAYEWVHGKISEDNVDDTHDRHREARENADDILQKQKDEDARKRRLMEQRAILAAKNVVVPVKASTVVHTESKTNTSKTTEETQIVTLQSSAESASLTKLGEFAKQLVKKFKPFNILFFVVGIFVAGKTLLRFDKLVLVAMFLGLMGAIWIRLSQIGDMNGRYFYTPYLIVLPIAAVGLQSCVLVFRAKLLPGIFTLLRIERNISPSFATSLLVTALAAGHLVDALGDEHPRRGDERKLGKWLSERHGPIESVLVDRGATRVGFFIGEKVPPSTEFFVEPGKHEEWRHPQILVLTKQLKPPDETAYMKEQLTAMKMLKLTNLPEKLAEDFEIYLRVAMPNQRKQTAQKNSTSRTARQ